MASTAIQDGLVQVMVLMSAVDRSMTDAELERIGAMVHTLPAFRDYDDERILLAARSCQETLQQENGLEKMLGQVADAIPLRFADTAYALAVEIAAVDLRVEPEELRLLQLLRDHLVLDSLTAAAIERAAQAKFRTAV